MNDSDEYPKDLEKVFKDEVHGSISFPPVCVAVINTPHFQRLRFIKQLGATSYVYPSATHTRFEHSLGVGHLARQMVGALKRRQPELKITRKDEICVTLAGLCHDLGHGPFSHIWEGFVKKAHHYDPQWKGWKHEETSAEMFEHLCKKNSNVKSELKKVGLCDKEVEFIKDLILVKEGKKSKIKSDKAFLYEIVNNKRTGVDVDKWDYILRDCQGLGIKVTFDYERVIQHSRVIPVKGRNRICVRDKEEDNLYDMYHARLSLHRKAYKHRVSQTVEAMLVDAFLLANRHMKYTDVDGKPLALADVYKDINAYTNLTDEVFHRILQDETDNEDMKKAKDILNNINSRKLYRYIGRTTPITTKQDNKQLMKVKDKLATNQHLDIIVVKFDYGRGADNPIKHVDFYTKKLPNKVKPKSETTYSAMLPESFQETFILVLCKSSLNQDFNDATESFKDACDEYNIKIGW